MAGEKTREQHPLTQLVDMARVLLIQEGKLGHTQTGLASWLGLQRLRLERNLPSGGKALREYASRNRPTTISRVPRRPKLLRNIKNIAPDKRPEVHFLAG